MKITRFHLPSLRNNEFFQYMTRVHGMIGAATPAALQIEALYGSFDTMYVNLGKAIRQITTSALTAKINDTDRSRDTLFSGMAGHVRSCLNHFDPTKRDAAERLIIVLNTFGNVAVRSHDEETAAVYKLTEELTANCPAEVEALELFPWIEELEKRNRAVEAAMMERFNEISARTPLLTRTCRLETGEVYYRIIKRIDALQIVEGADSPNSVWALFITELNEIIDHTKNIIAIRRGKAAAKKAEEEAAKKIDSLTVVD